MALQSTTKLSKKKKKKKEQIIHKTRLQSISVTFIGKKGDNVNRKLCRSMANNANDCKTAPMGKSVRANSVWY